MIKINNTEISDIKINDTSVSKVMAGSTLVWPSQGYLLLDILYSDANGNLSVSNQVLPSQEGKTPIALCIAATGFFGANEPARWMSLKYMNYTTPEVGSLSTQGIRWGNYGTDISTINNVSATYSNGSDWGYLTADWIEGTDNKVPSLFDTNGEWNTLLLGAVNTYAITDINGKSNTTKILATATAQSTWQTDTSIDNESGANYAPTACCCARYHTIGTQAGDWYLGACGEMAMIMAKKTDINTKLNAIRTFYSNDCISSIEANSYWTSTEVSDNNVYNFDTRSGYIMQFGKRSISSSIALLQY